MTTEKFEEILNARIETIKQTLMVKAKEYMRNDDRLHNFRKAATEKNTTMTDILWQRYALKHLMSLDDIIEDHKKGILPSLKTIDEKIGDIIIYGILLEACFIESIENKK